MTEINGPIIDAGFKVVGGGEEKKSPTAETQPDNVSNNTSSNLSAEAEQIPLTFEQKLDGLTRDNEQGPAPVTDPKLLKLIGALKMPQNQTREGIQRLINQGNRWYYETDDLGFENQWTILGAVIAGKLQEITSQANSTSEGEGTLERIAKAVEKSADLSQSQAKANEVEVASLKDDKAAQLKYFRSLVEQIEDGHADTRDWANSLTVKNIEAAYRNMVPEVKEEIEARLALHDASRLIYEANGHITSPKSDASAMTIGKAANEARERGHELSKHIIEYLLGDKIPDLKISLAWDRLQEVNIYDRRPLKEGEEKIPTYDDYIAIANYQKFVDNLITSGLVLDQVQLKAVYEFLKGKKFNLKKEGQLKPEVKDFLDKNNIPEACVEGLFKTDDLSELRDTDVALGKVKPTYYTDSNIARKEAVGRIIIERIASLGNIDIEKAKRSLLLAEKLSTATLETSIFNKRALAGSDDLAEMIDFDSWRKNRKKVGRDYGPLVTEGLIKGIGGSFFRTLKPELNVGDPSKDGTFYIDNTYPLWSDEINKKLLGEIKEGSWVNYCTVNLGRFSTVKDLLLETQIKPGDINIYYLRDKAVAAFNTADSYMLPKAVKDKIKEEHPEEEAEEIIRKREAKYAIGPNMLRYLWILGVVSEALIEPTVSGWDRNSIRALQKTVSIDNLSQDESVGPFIPPELWNLISKKVGIEERLMKLEAYTGFISGIGQGKSLGGKKR